MVPLHVAKSDTWTPSHQESMLVLTSDSGGYEWHCMAADDAPGYVQMMRRNLGNDAEPLATGSATLFGIEVPWVRFRSFYGKPFRQVYAYQGDELGVVLSIGFASEPTEAQVSQATSVFELLSYDASEYSKPTPHSELDCSLAENLLEEARRAGDTSTVVSQLAQQGESGLAATVARLKTLERAWQDAARRRRDAPLHNISFEAARANEAKERAAITPRYEALLEVFRQSNDPRVLHWLLELKGTPAKQKYDAIKREIEAAIFG